MHQVVFGMSLLQLLFDEGVAAEPALSTFDPAIKAYDFSSGWLIGPVMKSYIAKYEQVL